MLGALFLFSSALSRGPGPEAAKLDMSSSLLVTGRDSLRVCLKTGEGVSHARAVERLTEVFDQVRQHPHWASAGYGKSSPALETDCAPDVAPRRLTGRGALGAGITEKPGPHRAVLVVMDQAQADRMLPDRPALSFPYESMRLDSGSAATVTQGLILGESVLDQPELARLLVTAAVGLETEPGGHTDHGNHGEQVDHGGPTEGHKGG